MAMNANFGLGPNVVGREVQIPTGSATLTGLLSVPARADGLVLFTRNDELGADLSPQRDQWISQQLHRAGLGTLQFNLLTNEETEEERARGHLDFNIGLLKQRLGAAAHWVADEDEAQNRPVGFLTFGTASAAALVAAADFGDCIGAVVSGHGQPDLAGNALRRVKTPVLLMVGGSDDSLIELNEEAHEMLSGDSILRILPNAPAGFDTEESATELAGLAAEWFLEHLRPFHSPRAHRFSTWTR